MLSALRSHLKSPRYRKLRGAMAYATAIAPKLPHSSDTLLQKVIKTISVADQLLAGTQRGSAVYEYFSSKHAQQDTNRQLVELFFATGLLETFDVTRQQVGDNVEIIHASDPDIGDLWFVEYQYSTPERSDDFWFGDSFNFHKALSRLWKLYGNAIHVGLKLDRHQQGKCVYKPISPPSDPLLGDAPERLRVFLEQHARHQQAGHPRTYLFLGEPGCGKTTFALRAAATSNGRLLRLDARGMTTVGLHDLNLILKNLKPDFLVLDDIDKVTEIAQALPSLLELLTDLKDRHPKVTVILTASSVAGFDPAFLRPGRVDGVIDFKVPGDVERADLLTGYLEEFECNRQVHIVNMARACEGMTGAYIREVALQLCSRSDDEVLGLIKRMKELVAECGEGSDESKQAPECKPGKC